MNTFLNNLVDQTNFGYTENGAVKHLTTKSAVLDMFALCGSYRNRSDTDCILAFQNALEEDEALAMKCLFYLRDIIEGQGERRFFRVCFRWLCNSNPEVATRNLNNIPMYGRWDDIIYSCIGTKLEKEALSIIKKQLAIDLDSKTPSLLAKWLPSENSSSVETKWMGGIVRKYLGMSHKEYRKMLSALRSSINIVEKLMSENRWEEIEFEKVPSRAGLIYKNAFARRDIIEKKYREFIKSESTKVNAKTLYPYDIAHQAFACKDEDEIGRAAISKYWENLPNYYGDNKENGIAIVDTSGSMIGRPLEAAVSLGAYIAEKAHGPFANHFITFSNTPELIKFEGVDLVDKFKRAKRASWGFSTNLGGVFDLLLETIERENTKEEDIPQRLYIFSDMEFNGSVCGDRTSFCCTREDVETLLEKIAQKWSFKGYSLPPVVFWNLDARQQNIPALGGRFSYVSGLSPVMIQTILSGKDGYDLMLEKLMSARYAQVE